MAQKDGTIIETVPFAPLLMGEVQQAPVRPIGPQIEARPIEHVENAIVVARSANAEIRQNLSELWQGLQTLAQLNKAFSDYRSK